MDPVSNLGSTVLVNLAVVKVTSLNKADSPCVEEEQYSWTQCVKQFISEVKHLNFKTSSNCLPIPHSISRKLVVKRHMMIYLILTQRQRVNVKLKKS